MLIQFVKEKQSWTSSMAKQIGHGTQEQYLRDMEVVAEWSRKVVLLDEAEKTAVELRESLAKLERQHPFLGNLKGAIKKASSRSTSSGKDGEGKPSGSAPQAEKQKATTAPGKLKKKGEGEKSGGKKRKKDSSDEETSDSEEA